MGMPGDRRFWSMCPLPRVQVPFGVPIFYPQPNMLLCSCWKALREHCNHDMKFAHAYDILDFSVPAYLCHDCRLDVIIARVFLGMLLDHDAQPEARFHVCIP